MNSGVKHPWLVATARAFKQPAFVCAVVLMALAAVGLNAAVLQLKLSFKKQPVPLARDLTQIPFRMGDWVCVRRDEPLDSEIQDSLGTDKYIFRDYVNLSSHDGAPGMDFLRNLENQNSSVTSQQMVDLLDRFHQANVSGRCAILQDAVKDLRNAQRRQALVSVQAEYPDSVVNMAVTYYTGLVDTVAHIPDRCYLANGFEPTDADFPTWTLGNGTALPVRFINFQDQNGSATVDCSVAYFFFVNGQVEADSTAVRRRLQNLFQRYGYYAKVELMTLDSDHVRSANTMTQFLSGAINEVQSTLPDWTKYDSARGKSS